MAHALSLAVTTMPSAPLVTAAKTNRIIATTKANKMKGVTHKQFQPEFLHFAVNMPKIPVIKMITPETSARRAPA